MDCSPTDRERELGLDRRETGWFYPTFQEIARNRLVKSNGVRSWNSYDYVCLAAFVKLISFSKVKVKTSKRFFLILLSELHSEVVKGSRRYREGSMG